MSFRGIEKQLLLFEKFAIFIREEIASLDILFDKQKHT